MPVSYGKLPNLTAGEVERLAYLIEEASEVIKAAAKILRHGRESVNPDDPDAGDNVYQLEMELADFQMAINMMSYSKDVSSDVIDQAVAKKMERRKDRPARYFHHQQDGLIGFLESDGR